jgi:hypothetical protein
VFHQWESTLFTFSLIIGSATEKVFQFFMPLKSIYTKSFGFIVFLKTTKRSKEEKLLKDTIFVKVGLVKVYLRQTWNFKSHAVSACISL